MQRSLFHIVVVLLLAVLYIGGRAVPCVEICADACAGESAVVADLSSDHHDDHDAPVPSEKGHHCDHCSCPCHIPALSTAEERFVPEEYPDRAYKAVVYPLSSAALHPPDHIPLA